MHGVSKLGTALADRPGSADEAGVNRLLRARAMEAARQSLEVRESSGVTSGWWLLVTNLAKDPLGRDAFESGGEGGKEGMTREQGRRHEEM